MHGSATVVDKVTKAKIPMVTGGRNYEGYLDTTELLINGMWQSGTIQCPKNGNHVLISLELFVQSISFVLFLLTLGQAQLLCSEKNH